MTCCPRSPPWLHVARALIVGAFRETDATHVLFRDDDVDVSGSTVARMIAADAAAIVAPYVLRDDDNAAPARFDVTLEPDGSVRWAGLGCALVRRDVLERLWTDYEGELGFERQGRAYVAMFRDFFGERDNGVELICEDAAFWWRVRLCGFRVQALDDCEVRHAGQSMRWTRPRLRS